MPALSAKRELWTRTDIAISALVSSSNWKLDSSDQRRISHTIYNLNDEIHYPKTSSLTSARSFCQATQHGGAFEQQNEASHGPLIGG